MKTNNATKIGIMVICALGILLFMTVKAGNFNFFKKGYTVVVTFKDVDGVDTNSPVMFNGFKVGTVKSVDIDYQNGTKMMLTLFLNENVRLRDGTKAQIKNLGFMGEKYIALSAGDMQNDKLLQPDSIIVGQEPTDFAVLMAKGNEFLTKLNEIASNVNDHLEVNKDWINDMVMNANATMMNLNEISNSINVRLSSNEENIDSILKNFNELSGHLNTASVNLEEMSLDLKLNPWKLLRRVKENKAGE